MDPPTLASLLHNVPVPQGFPRRLRRRGRNLQGRLNLDQPAAGEDTRVDGEQDGGIQDEEPVLMDPRNVHEGEVQAEAADLVAPRTVEGEQEREVHAEAADLMDPNTIALDENLVCKLPSNARIVTASDHGSGHASRIIHFNTRAPTTLQHRNGIYRSYHLKLSRGKKGYDVMRGEFNSAKAVHEVVPNLVPKPIAWGTLSQDVNIHFILCVFHGTNHQSISAIHFAESVAKLHQKSAAPDNKFGFSITTHIGTLAQNNARTTSWEAYFSINFSQLLHLEKAIQRSDNLELENLSNAMLTKVIPRLLRPLETDGRSVIPVLLHGDISYNNLSASLKTKRPIVFDSAAFYGHNEYDLRNVALGLPGIEFLEVYNETIPVSDPKEDFQDRMVLYGLRDYLHESCLHPGDKIFREQLVAGMKVLVEKFPGGYEAWLEMVEGFKTMMEDEI